jgi:hypothetical protein
MEQYIFSRDDIVGDELTKGEKTRILEEKKSELLKDVLAMANAWSDGPRYILLGFRENKPGIPTVVGIPANRLHDDAAFQQFIGSKVNSPLQFKYEVQEFQGVSVGIITIAKQRRPFFSKERVGVVDKGVAYVRRGSSTAIADLAEVAAMGATDHGARPEATVAIELTNDGDSFEGSTYELRNPIFGPQPLPDYAEQASGPFGMHLAGLHGRADRDYWRKLRTFLETSLRAVPIRIDIRNGSEFALTHCELHVVAELDGTSLRVQLGDDRPQVPSAQWEVAHLLNVRVADIRATKTVELNADGDGIVASFDRILPGAKATAPELFSIVPERSGQVALSCTLYANELKEPRTFKLQCSIMTMDEAWDIDKLVELDSDLRA